jgi:hypothetical protein
MALAFFCVLFIFVVTALLIHWYLPILKFLPEPNTDPGMLRPLNGFSPLEESTSWIEEEVGIWWFNGILQIATESVSKVSAGQVVWYYAKLARQAQHRDLRYAPPCEHMSPTVWGQINLQLDPQYFKASQWWGPWRRRPWIHMLACSRYDIKRRCCRYCARLQPHRTLSMMTEISEAIYWNDYVFIAGRRKELDLSGKPQRRKPHDATSQHEWPCAPTHPGFEKNDQRLEYVFFQL